MSTKKLARKLSELNGKGMGYVFFADVFNRSGPVVLGGRRGGALTILKESEQSHSTFVSFLPAKKALCSNTSHQNVFSSGSSSIPSFVCFLLRRRCSRGSTFLMTSMHLEKRLHLGLHDE
jgi:hypothetical protein